MRMDKAERFPAINSQRLLAFFFHAMYPQRQ
jgi:hypothetical protein